MRCKADGNGLVYSSPDQVSDDACTQDRRADNRGRDSGVEGAADDVLDGCLLEMDAPLDEKSCLGGDLSFDEFELRDGPEGGVSVRWRRSPRRWLVPGACRYQQRRGLR